MSYTFKENLLRMLKAEIPLYYVETFELKELREDVEEVCKLLKKSLFFYTPEQGGRLTCQLYKGKAGTDRIENFNRNKKNAECPIEELLVRLNNEPPLRDPSSTSIPVNSVVVASGVSLEPSQLSHSVVEGVACGNYSKNKTALICAGPLLEIPEELNHYATILKYELPTAEEIQAALYMEMSKLRDAIEAKAQKSEQEMPEDLWFLDQDNLQKISEQMTGMTVLEAKHAFNLSVVSFPRDTDLKRVMPLVKEQKTEIIKKSHSCSIVPDEDLPYREDLGGFDRLIDFIKVRASAFTPAAELQHIDPPRGLILLGLPGTGKSMAARTIGRLLNLPVIMMDVNSVFNSYIGVSENRMKQELARVDALNGCVLILNEADKVFPTENSDSEDGGVAKRVFGVLLNWLQEYKSKTVTIATMNNAEGIPPEFLRAGRFDAIFFSGLPNAKERKEILQAHFRKRDSFVYLPEKDWDEIIDKTEHFVCSELEIIVIDSRYIAFTNRETSVPTKEEILQAISQRKPLYEFQKDKMDKLLKGYAEKALPTGY